MIKFENISKSYGTKKVLTNLNLSIPPQKTTALLGPNGSGKSTVIKSVLGLIKPDEGTITVHNQSISTSVSYRSLIGYMPQIAHYPDNLSVQELFSMIADIRDSSLNSMEELIELFELKEHRTKSMNALSGGTRQKVSAVAALMFDTPILILDEPSVGLDPRMALRFKDYLKKEKAKEKTIILTTHILSEVEELADELIFILEGKIVFQGSTDSLLQQTGKNNFEHAIAFMLEDNIIIENRQSLSRT